MDDVGHRREVIVQQDRERFRIQHLGNPGKSFQIGEKDGEHSSFAAQLQMFGVLNELFDDCRAQVLFKGVLNEHLLTTLGGIINETGAEECDGNARFLNDQRQPEPLTVSDEAKDNRCCDKKDIDHSAFHDAGDGRRCQTGQESDQQGHSDDKGRRDGPDKIIGQEVIEDGGVNLHAGIDTGHGGRAQVEQAGCGKSKKYVGIFKGVRVGDGGLFSLLDAKFALNDGCGTVGFMGSRGAAEVENGVSPAIDRDLPVPDGKMPGSYFQRGARLRGEIASQGKRWQHPAVKDMEERRPSVDVIPVRIEVDIAQDTGAG